MSSDDLYICFVAFFKNSLSSEGPIVNLLIRSEYGTQWANSPKTLIKIIKLLKYSIPKKLVKLF